MKKGDTISMDECEENIACEQRMREGFATTAASILADALRYEKTGDTLFAGLEIELPLITQAFELSPQDGRDALIEQHPKHASAELGAHQIEIINEPPVDLLRCGFRALQDQITTTMDTVLNEARKQSLRAVRIGCYPLTEANDIKYTKGGDRYKKYERCPQWHTANRRRDTNAELGRTEVINADNAYIVALMNSVQITVDAQNFSDAVDKLNRSLMISPYAMAIGANARYMSCRDTGICDVRFDAWEISHDVRSPAEAAAGRLTRVGLPQCYYRSVEDYFGRIQTYPFILNDPISMAHPFEVGIGLYWRDARLKFFQEKGTIAVEFRPVALQPSLDEDVVMMFFFIGRLTWSQHNQEPLLPMNKVRANKEQATAYGLNSQLWRQNRMSVEQAPGRRVMADEINRAAEGLNLLGASPDVVDGTLQVLEQRLNRGSPAEQFAAAVQSIETGILSKQKDRRRNAIISAIQQLGLIVP